MLHGQGIITERKFENYTLITNFSVIMIFGGVSMQHILIVEDDLDIQELLKNFLQEVGYAVRSRI